MPSSRTITASLAVICSLSVAACAAHATPPATGNDGRVWQQTFGDDFDGPVVDPLEWTTCYFWVAANGCTNSANGELQWYQPANAFTSDGTLKLRARREHVVAPSGKSYEYTSGMVSTGRSTGSLATPPRYDFTYGYAEIRMRVPAGRGLWPAFWLLPSSHGWPPELDVFEAVGSRPTSLSMNDHYSGSDGSAQSYGRSYTGPDFSAGWHTVGLDWSADRLVWYVDGVARHWTTDPQMIPDEPMYLLADLAVGGTWPGAPDASTSFPADLEIDYIRVWQRVDTPAATTNAAGPVTSLPAAAAPTIAAVTSALLPSSATSTAAPATDAVPATAVAPKAVAKTPAARKARAKPKAKAKKRPRSTCRRKTRKRAACPRR